MKNWGKFRVLNDINLLVYWLLFFRIFFKLLLLLLLQQFLNIPREQAIKISKLTQLLTLWKLRQLELESMLLLNELLLLQNRELMGGSFTIFLALSLSVGAIIHVELRVH
jgi:hypothetical protein